MIRHNSPERPHQAPHRPLRRPVLAERRAVQIRRNRALEDQARLRELLILRGDRGGVLAAEVVEGELRRVEHASEIDFDHVKGRLGRVLLIRMLGGEDFVWCGDAGVGDDDVDEVCG